MSAHRGFLSGRPLRIVHCVRAPIGGIFRNVLDLSSEQSARGHLVGIVLDSCTGGEFEASKIAEAAPGLRLGITRLPMSRSITPSDLVSAWRVYAVVRELAPDVMHGHGAKGGTFARLAGSLPSAQRRPVARIYTPHGGSLHYSKHALAGCIVFRLERLLERVCDGIIHVSRFEAEDYLDKIGKARCGASVIVNGLRADEFADCLPAPDAKDIVFMGMMRDLKGPDVLLRALALIRDRGGHAPSLAMIGDGPDRGAYMRLADALGLAERVFFHDPRPTREGLAMGRVMVIPSRAESMPYIVLESVAGGLPLIASKVGGIPEILGPRAIGLVPSGDVKALADAIEAALVAPEAMRARAHATRNILRETLSTADMANRVERVYRAALARRRAKGPIASGALQPAQ